jgi:predicted DCC family thiol-disulfide oxidoreductase YuxK
MTASRTAHIVLYDAECSLCTFQSRLITWMDWFNTVALMPIADPRAREIAPCLTRTDLHEAIHCVTKHGKIYRGARCLRFIGMRMPLALPFSLFLWAPGVIGLAEIFYRWLSRNRYVLSRVFGCKEACGILPARKRRNEEQISTAVRESGSGHAV